MKMNLMSLMFVAGLSGSALAGPFQLGNLVVVRVGDAGGGTLNSAGTLTYLDEYTPGGSLVQTISLPTSASGANKRLVTSGSATTEGTLTRSDDRNYLTIGGYDAAVGTAAIGTTSTSGLTPVLRVMGRVGFNGVVDTSTSTTAFSGNSIRSVVSSDGAQFWMTGGNNGVQYASSLGASSSILINSTGATNNRQINIFGGQLYVASASGTSRGVNTVGTGLPTTGSQAMTLLAGTGSITGSSPNDFYIANATTMYIADDSQTAGVGGLQRWDLTAGTWSRTGNFTPANGGRLRQMTGTTNAAGQTLLYVTVIDSVGLPSIQSFTDIGASSGFTNIVTGAANTAWRGIDFAPIPAPGALSLLGLSGLVVARRRR